MTDIKLKYLPSQAAFIWGDLVISPKSSGCLRNIWFSAHGLKDEFPAELAKLGAVMEEHWYQELLKDETIEKIDREVVVKDFIPGQDKVTYSGRLDALVTYKNGFVELHETKATSSKRVRGDIRKGRIPINYLAQLVSYMIQLENGHGKLIIGYFEDDNGKLICTEKRAFIVNVSDEGLILVDGQPSGYRVSEQLGHMQKAASMLTEATTPSRPADWQQKWTSPCNYCPFKKACDENEKPTVEQAKQSLEEHKLKPRKAVEITKHKRKKEKVK
jgi:hypothetical protein